MSHQSQLDKMCPRAGKLKLGTWLQSVRTWIVDMAARQAENKDLLDELYDDHATSKTALDEIEILVGELHDDHAAFKTSVDETKTLVDELHDDHATYKTAVDETKALADELHDDHATYKTAVDETKALVDELHDDHETFKSAMDSMKNALKNMCLSDVGTSIGTLKTNARSTSTATYLVDGEFKSKVSTDNLWALTGFNCTNGKYNKCFLCLDSTTSSQITSGTEADAPEDVALPSIPGDWGVVAMIQVHPTGTGDFTGGTTDLDDATVVPNATFTDLAFYLDGFGITPDTLSASKPSAGPETLSAGKPSAGPDTLSASKPSVGPDALLAGKPSTGPDTLSAGKPSSGSGSLSSSKPTSLSSQTPDTLAS